MVKAVAMVVEAKAEARAAAGRVEGEEGALRAAAPRAVAPPVVLEVTAAAERIHQLAQVEVAAVEPLVMAVAVELVDQAGAKKVVA